VGGLVFGAQDQCDIRAKRSHHSVLQIIHSLTDYTEKLLNNQTSIYSLADILSEARRVVNPGTTLFVISDFCDLGNKSQGNINGQNVNGKNKNEVDRHLFQLSRHCDLTLCHTYDGLDSQLPPPGSYAITDGEHQQVFNTRKQNIRTQFEQQFRNRTNRLQQLCGQLNMGYLAFPTAKPVISVLQKAYAGKRPRRRS